MKCPHCYALNAPGDTACSGCGASLAGIIAAAQPTPAWVYLFVVACGIIPVVALGGLIPIILGVGGASSCLAAARQHSIPWPLRFLACVGVTCLSWFIFLALMAAVLSAK